jgi:hypothetical protein
MAQIDEKTITVVASLPSERDLQSRRLNESPNLTVTTFQIGESVLVFRKDIGGSRCEADIIEIKKTIDFRTSYVVRYLGVSQSGTVEEKYIRRNPEVQDDSDVVSRDTSPSVEGILKTGEMCEIYVPQKNTWIAAKVLEYHPKDAGMSYYKVEAKSKAINVRAKHVRPIAVTSIAATDLPSSPIGFIKTGASCDERDESWEEEESQRKSKHTRASSTSVLPTPYLNTTLMPTGGVDMPLPVSDVSSILLFKCFAY